MNPPIRNWNLKNIRKLENEITTTWYLRIVVFQRNVLGSVASPSSEVDLER